jgi:hypothetical protein
MNGREAVNKYATTRINYRLEPESVHQTMSSMRTPSLVMNTMMKHQESSLSIPSAFATSLNTKMISHILHISNHTA